MLVQFRKVHDIAARTYFFGLGVYGFEYVVGVHLHVCSPVGIQRRQSRFDASLTKNMLKKDINLLHILLLTSMAMVLTKNLYCSAFIMSFSSVNVRR